MLGRIAAFQRFRPWLRVSVCLCVCVLSFRSWHRTRCAPFPWPRLRARMRRFLGCTDCSDCLFVACSFRVASRVRVVGRGGVGGGRVGSGEVGWAALGWARTGTPPSPLLNPFAFLPFHSVSPGACRVIVTRGPSRGVARPGDSRRVPRPSTWRPEHASLPPSPSRWSSRRKPEARRDVGRPFRLSVVLRYAAAAKVGSTSRKVWPNGRPEIFEAPEKLG